MIKNYVFVGNGYCEGLLYLTFLKLLINLHMSLLLILLIIMMCGMLD